MEWAKKVTHSADGSKLDAKEKVVLLLLVDMTNAATGDAWPLISTLATYSALSERSVRYALSGLKDKGLIKVTYQKVEQHKNLPNRYKVIVDASLLDSVELVAAAGTAIAEPAPVVAAPERLTVRAVAAELCGEGGIVDALLVDLDPTAAYVQALTYADELADAYPDLSKDPRAFLRNAVVSRAALDLHGIEARAAARLAKEAKVLGPGGHQRIVQALTHTASADIKGDAVSYVCAAARRLNGTVVS